MKIRLEVNERGKWQADVWPNYHEGHHATAETAWDALIELGMHWKSLNTPPDGQQPDGVVAQGGEE